MPHVFRTFRGLPARLASFRRSVVVALLLAAALAGTAHAGTFESGDVDPGFGDAGVPGWRRIYTAGGSENEYAVAFAQRADGNYVVLLTEPDGNGDVLIVLRLYSRDGDLLDGLGGTGTVIRDAGFYSVHDLVIDAAGRIVVAGTVQATGERSNVAMVRFHPNGDSDLDFGDGGVFTAPFDVGEATDDTPVELIEQPTGTTSRYVALVQRRNEALRPKIGLVGVTLAGNLDPGFGNRPAMPGRSLLEFVEGHLGDPKALVQTATNLFIAGAVDYSSTDTDVAVQMLTDDGVGYNGDFGTLVIPVDIEYPQGQTFDGADAMLLDQAGRLVIAGHAGYRLIVLRVLQDRFAGLDLDTTFATQGTPARNHIFVGNDTSVYPQAIAERPEDGEVFVVGAREVASTTAGFVQRVDPDGLRGTPDDGMRTYLAPTTGGAQSFYTRFEQVLVDRARPVVLGWGPDNASALSDVDGLLTRLATTIRPPEVFADGFE